MVMGEVPALSPEDIAVIAAQLGQDRFPKVTVSLITIDNLDALHG